MTALQNDHAISIVHPISWLVKPQSTTFLALSTAFPEKSEHRNRFLIALGIYILTAYRSVSRRVHVRGIAKAIYQNASETRGYNNFLPKIRISAQYFRRTGL